VNAADFDLLERQAQQEQRLKALQAEIERMSVDNHYLRQQGDQLIVDNLCLRKDVERLSVDNHYLRQEVERLTLKLKPGAETLR